MSHEEFRRLFKKLVESQELDKKIAEDGVNPEEIFSYTYVWSENGITYYTENGNEVTEAQYNEQIAGKTEVTDFEWRELFAESAEVTIDAFIGGYTSDQYCFELVYMDEVLSVSSGELPYGGMFHYSYHSFSIDGNALIAEHDEGTDTYIINSDGTINVMYNGFLEYRNALYMPHEGSVF